MKRTRMEKGITLIALLVTIVVLIILAAVTISTLGDEESGVIVRTQEAINRFQIAEHNEMQLLNAYVDYMDEQYANIGNNGGTTETESKLGSFVTYKGLTWRVLTDDNSSVELITENFTVSRTINGVSDFETAMHVFGDAKMNIDSDCISGTGISRNIRSVKETDMEKLQSLGLADINNDYWLYDSIIIPEPDAPYTNMKGYYWKYVDSNGNVQNAFLFYTYDPMSVQRTDSHTKQVRPIITLEAGALDNVTGSGTSAQPYVLN